MAEKNTNLERDLEKYEKYSGEIIITLGYSIDYDDEIEEYDFTEEGYVQLTYGTMEWEQAKSIGFDWIRVEYRKGSKVFLDLELA